MTKKQMITVSEKHTHCTGTVKYAGYRISLNTSRALNISGVSWFTYSSSLTGLHCLRVISVHHEAINILAFLFQIADLNLSLTF